MLTTEALALAQSILHNIDPKHILLIAQLRTAQANAFMSLGQLEQAEHSNLEALQFADKMILFAPVLAMSIRARAHNVLGAIHAMQRAVGDGKDRFLFEMATGTGKTLTAAAVIKLFLRSSNAKRVLFLVDRLELEDQAKKAFTAVLAADFKTVIYKENRGDWRHAEIVVTTVQSLLFNNKYQQIFSPTDFDLVIF